MIDFVATHRSDMYNPWPPPDENRFKEQRAVPYSLPPVPIQEAEEEWQRQAAQGTQRTQKPRELGADDDHQLKGQNLENFSMRFFNITPPGIGWRNGLTVAHARRYALQTLRPYCWKQDYTWTPAEFETRKKDLDAIQHRGYVDSELVKQFSHIKLLMVSLDRCKEFQSCGVTRVRFIENPKGGTTAFEICNLRHPVVPTTGFGLLAGQKARLEGSVFFQKNLKAVYLHNQHDAKKEGEGSNTLFMNAIIALTNADAQAHLLLEHFLSACRCKEDNCKSFYDYAVQRYRWWCEVADTSVRACRMHSVKIFSWKEDKYGGLVSKKYWSEELCRRAHCHCSHIGMLPQRGDSSLRLDLMLIGNDTARKLERYKYGTHCAKWNADDYEPWCFVGYDTVCPDRSKIFDKKKIERDWGTFKDIPKTIHQFKSTYYCVAKQQGSILYRLKDKCHLMVGLFLLGLSLLQIFSFPMIVIVFKFLVRRCGDHFALDDQFDAIFSSGDDSDNENAGRSLSFDARQSSVELADMSSSTRGQT